MQDAGRISNAAGIETFAPADRSREADGYREGDALGEVEVNVS